MLFRSLRQKINFTLLLLALIVFAVVALASGLLEYREVRAEYSRGMTAKISMARSLVADSVFQYDKYVRDVIGQSDDEEAVEEMLATLLDQLHFHSPEDTYYVLDSQGTVIIIADPYADYWGLDFGVLLPSKERSNITISHHQSLLTRQSVVSIQYPLPLGMYLVVERGLENIIPAMTHLQQSKLFSGELFFVLSSSGQVAYHPDTSLIKRRHNLAFDMKNKSLPDTDGQFSFVLNGIEYAALSEEFSVPPGWIIYYAVPQAEMVKVVQAEVINQVIGLLAIFVIIFLILQVALARFFTKPVSRIVDSLQRSHGGEGLVLTADMAAGTLELQTIIGEILNRDQAVALATERFQTVLDSLDAAVYVADMQTYEILFINSYGRKVWGDITGKICWQSIQKGQSGPCEFCTNHLLLDENGRPAGIHVWELQNTVNNHWYECRDQAIQWTDNRLVRMEVAHDISRRKEAEEELLAEKERLAVTLHSIGDGVITTDVEGKIVLINRVAEELTGWRQDEAQGRPFLEVFHVLDGETKEPCADPVSQVLKKGQIITLAENTMLLARDGSERIVADSGAPIRDKESRIVGVVLVFRDVTEENQLREEALKAKKLESVGVLAGGIAHDFNNILAAILGNIDLAVHMVGEDHESYRLLQMAEKASVRARGLTQQLLTFAKGGDPVLETASLKEVISESASFVLSGSNVSCSFDFPEDLWWADIDKGQISQVVQNIIINADHAMPDGGKIEVKCENVALDTPGILPLPVGRYVRMSIADTGYGIDEESLARIFDPYFSTKEVGQGLGLAVVRSIIQKHGGCIVADSEKGSGTTFTIYLPASDLEQKKMEDLFITPEPATKMGRIMIMDDEEMVRDIASKMLDHFGYETVLAADGDEAIEKYKEAEKSGESIDLVIMDLTIPGGMGGKDAVKKLLDLNPDARVIVASGYANDPVMANCRAYGFMAAVKKPFQMSELAWVVEQNIQKSSVGS